MLIGTLGLLLLFWLVGSALFAPTPIEAMQQKISGPVGLVVLITHINDYWVATFFAAAMSLNLAVVNSLPFSVLDGGHIALSVFEKDFPRASEKWQSWIKNGMSICIICLIVLTLSSDIMRVWHMIF